MKSQINTQHRIKQEYWQQQISDWKTSGLSQKQYCLNRSLALSTFCYWKSRINNPKSTAPTFFPLTIPTSPPDPPDAGLALLVGPKRFKIEIKEGFSQIALKKIIATLEQL